MSYLDNTGLNTLWAKLKSFFVAKESGKGLSTNDFSDEDKGNLDTVVETVGGLSLNNLGAVRLTSVGTSQSTATLPSTTGAFIVVTTHNSTANNNGIWIIRGASGVFKIGGGSNITITKNNATLTVKSSSGNSDLYIIKLN